MNIESRAPSQRYGAEANLDDAVIAAVLHHQAGRLAEAERLYRIILAVNCQNSDALHLLGVIALQNRQSDGAVTLIRQAIRLNGSVAAYYANLGLALKEQGLHEEAVTALASALQLDPDNADAHYNVGNLYKELGRHFDAVAAYLSALRIRREFAEACANLGIALKEMGRLQDAAAVYCAALCIKPDLAECHSNLGNALGELGQPDAAIKAYSAALRLRPDFAEAHFNLGNALQELGRREAAIGAYHEAIRLKPDMVEAHSNLGTALQDSRRLDDAVEAFGIALDIRRSQADRTQGQPGRQDLADAYCNLGKALKSLGRLDDAIAAYGDAIRQKPDHVDAHYNLSIAHLLRGDLEAGWQKYDLRWRAEVKRLAPRDFIEPQWRGEDLAGRTILLHAEQGYGDTLQFCRFAPMVAERGGRVLLEVPRPLHRLLSTLPGVDHLIVAGSPLPDFAVHCPLMSLPGAFSTSIETIPRRVPYLQADNDAVRKWRERIGRTGFRIGIAWQGNPSHPDDRGRSAPLACFAPLADLPGVRLISLQKHFGLEDLDRLPPGMQVETLGEEFECGSDAFIDCAAVMQQLDLIISVDTAIGHLAGALGLPVWLALKAVPHWVWMLDRDDTPWYPTMRLFRQTEPDDWDALFAGMAAALDDEIRSRP